MIYEDGKIRTDYKMTFTKMKKMYKDNREEFKLKPKEYKWFNTITKNIKYVMKFGMN